MLFSLILSDSMDILLKYIISLQKMAIFLKFTESHTIKESFQLMKRNQSYFYSMDYYVLVLTG